MDALRSLEVTFRHTSRKLHMLSKAKKYLQVAFNMSFWFFCPTSAIVATCVLGSATLRAWIMGHLSETLGLLATAFLLLLIIYWTAGFVDRWADRQSLILDEILRVFQAADSRVKESYRRELKAAKKKNQRRRGKHDAAVDGEEASPLDHADGALRNDRRPHDAVTDCSTRDGEWQGVRHRRKPNVRMGSPLVLATCDATISAPHMAAPPSAPSAPAPVTWPPPPPAGHGATSTLPPSAAHSKASPPASLRSLRTICASEWATQPSEDDAPESDDSTPAPLPAHDSRLESPGSAHDPISAAFVAPLSEIGSALVASIRQAEDLRSQLEEKRSELGHVHAALERAHSERDNERSRRMDTEQKLREAQRVMEGLRRDSSFAQTQLRVERLLGVGPGPTESDWNRRQPRVARAEEGANTSHAEGGAHASMDASAVIGGVAELAGRQRHATPSCIGCFGSTFGRTIGDERAYEGSSVSHRHIPGRRFVGSQLQDGLGGRQAGRLGGALAVEPNDRSRRRSEPLPSLQSRIDWATDEAHGLQGGSSVASHRFQRRTVSDTPPPPWALLPWSGFGRRDGDHGDHGESGCSASAEMLPQQLSPASGEERSEELSVEASGAGNEEVEEGSDERGAKMDAAPKRGERWSEC